MAATRVATSASDSRPDLYACSIRFSVPDVKKFAPIKAAELKFVSHGTAYGEGLRIDPLVLYLVGQYLRRMLDENCI